MKEFKKRIKQTSIDPDLKETETEIEINMKEIGKSNELADQH